MTLFLRQSTTVTLRVGPFLDKTDGVTEKTALSPVVEISKNNAAFAARGSATAITHDSNGWYAVELNATDTGTLGPLVLKSDDAATHLPVYQTYVVVPANVYDSLILGTATLSVDATKWAGAATATNDTALATTPSNFASLSITAGGLVDITQAAADKVWSSTTRTLTAFSTALALSVWNVLETAITTASSIGLKVKTNLDAAVTTRSTFDPTTDAVATVTTVTNMRGTDNATLAVNYTTARAAKLDNLDAAISTTSTFDPILDTVATVTNVTNLHANAATSANQTTILNRIGGFAGSGLNTVKGFLQALFRSDAGITSANEPSEINEVLNTVAGTFDGTTDSVEAIRNTAPLGTAMRGTDNAALAADYTTARAAKLDNLDAAISTRSTFAPATDTVANVTTVANMRGTDGAALAADYTTARAAKLDNLDAAISTRSTLDAATVKAQVDQALSGDAQTESYAAKGANATIVQLLYMLLSALGDYGVSGTTITTRKLDGTTTAMTFTIDDSALPTSRTRAT